MSNAPILSASGLSKRYGHLTVLDNISFSLQPGSIVALLGANGAGKTTTFKCVLGMTDFSGQIQVSGKSVAKAGKEVRKLVGYLPQTPGFADDDTCFEALRFFAELRRVSLDSVDALLGKVNLSPQHDVRVRELSGGMRQRLALAAAMLSDPPLLLLDEPTANLDSQSREDLHALLIELRDEGRTVVLSTHFVEHVADIADRVVFLKDGKVELDETMAALGVEQGKDFIVHLNGAAPESFRAALRRAAITGDAISPARPDLQRAISRAIARKSDQGESHR